MNNKVRKVLRIDASMRRAGSVSRALTDAFVATLPDTEVVTRDLAETRLPQIDEAWIGANFTPAGDRTDEQTAVLALSDELVAELRTADTIVIGVPVYNFGVPAALKAWVDLVARAGETFRYTESCPVGLLENKKVVLLLASGGVGVDSPADFVTPYLRQVLGFIGITDVEVIAADGLATDPSKLDAARNAIEQRLAA